jgi:hypothetical protein
MKLKPLQEETKLLIVEMINLETLEKKLRLTFVYMLPFM